MPTTSPALDTTVETVRGAVPTESLGRVLMHEHVFILTPEIVENYAAVIGWDEEQRIEDAVRRLNAVAATGIDTIVDLTVLGMGRSLSRVQRINERVDLNIVAATGLYTFDLLPPFLSYVGPGAALDRVDPLVEMFIRDITVGIADTGVKAGIFKCATDAPGITPNVDRVLRAVAQAHRETGVPISTHTDAHNRRGLEQQDLFESEGVDLSRVVIGHCGDTTDTDYLRAVADRGSYLGMDRFGMNDGDQWTFEARAAVVVEMCELGYASQMVLSHDAQCWIDWLPPEMAAGTPLDYPDREFSHLTTKVLPVLRERGVTEEQITAMLVDNPAKVLAASKGGY
jgi:phosphotriesterase-related protein